MASLPGATNPYAGGAINRINPPTAVAGSIPAASTGGHLPVGGVNPSTPFVARPNTGSNIRIPYARLCPLSSHNNMGLMSMEVDANDELIEDNLTKLGDGRVRVMNETDELYTSRIAFVLGNRRSMAVGDDRLTFPTETEDFHAGVAVPYGPNVPGIAGPLTMHKVCSFEYLVRYFANYLSRKYIDLDDPITPGEKNIGRGIVNTTRSIADQLGTAGNDPFAGGTLLQPNNDTGDLAFAIASDSAKAFDPYSSRPQVGYPPDKTTAGNAMLQGIFAKDQGPFLRGKGTEDDMVDVAMRSDKVQTAVSTAEYNSSRTQVSRCLGDDVAFALLEERMAAKGLMDWTPDGIVLSRGTNDPTDKLSDELFDAKDGQLFNIVIQGPAITSTWNNNPRLEVLPTDKVFVVLVADVWHIEDLRAYSTASAGGSGTVGTEMLKAISDFTNGTANDMTAKAVARKTYMEAKQKFIAADSERIREANSRDFFKSLQEEGYADAGASKVRMTNFRVALTTSSQMINESKVSFTVSDDGSGTQSVDSRMGLYLGNGLAERIVGGWCIGTVLDSAASRASMPSGSLIGVRTAPNTMAQNINVGVAWWGADQLWKHFQNKDGGILTRFDHEDASTRYIKSNLPGNLFAQLKADRKVKDNASQQIAALRADRKAFTLLAPGNYTKALQFTYAKEVGLRTLSTEEDGLLTEYDNMNTVSYKQIYKSAVNSVKTDAALIARNMKPTIDAVKKASNTYEAAAQSILATNKAPNAADQKKLVAFETAFGLSVTTAKTSLDKELTAKSATLEPPYKVLFIQTLSRQLDVQLRDYESSVASFKAQVSRL